MKLDYITSKRQGHVLLIGLNRPEKLNAVDLRMLEELATFRAPARVGWGNAMRFLLAAEEFGAADAHRIREPPWRLVPGPRPGDFRLEPDTGG